MGDGGLMMGDIWLGFVAISEPLMLLAIAVGGVLGLVIGVLPGVGPGVAIAALLPLTYGMPPLAGISLLLGVYVGAFYGGAVTSILIRTPGEASSIMTMFDGWPMAKRGEAERALSLAFGSAFIGGIFSALVLALVAQPVSLFTSRFGAAEKAMAAIFAAILVARAYHRQFPAALMMLGLGLLVGSIGFDNTSGTQRFTFDIVSLQSGLPLVPMAIGLFGLAQALVLISGPGLDPDRPRIEARRPHLGQFLEPFRYVRTLAKSVGIGTAIGILPAVGAALSTTLAYFEAKRSSSQPEQFGRGNPEGIVAAEAANNSNSGGAMLTVLTLGIPGDAVTAIIMGVFVVHGVVPGPMLFAEQPTLVNGIFASLVLVNVAIVIALFFSTRWLASLTRVDPRWLGIGIMAFCVIGAYSTSNSFYGVWVAIGAGVLGWICALASIPVVPMVLGLVLGDTLEASLRQALTVSDGSFAIFVERPIAAVLTAACVLSLVWPWLRARRRKLTA
jgi:putative tricarboxylic transport membrane protein